eukprot:CAMPEP_0176009554 /NCGR_PEP_ID=MMETSP0120_2-20121206/4310_1 /TAXON_ID=160619 /ORGANISM="Kryptoperidinium foliaceum, Strain CCMP 1326" /LENGTH=743 /DNA_ID=CAMNT_0017342353 /DNA_START=174 /DNA_END=2402 /DNA_ORIENTATION=-
MARSAETPLKRKSYRIAFALIVVVIPIMYMQFHLVTIVESEHVGKAVRLEEFLGEQTSPIQRRTQVQRPAASTTQRPILTAYLEPPSTITYDPLGRSSGPSFSRNTSAKLLLKAEYPGVNCDQAIPNLPIDNYPTQDPFLPWLHDYFVSEDSRYIRFVAQNRRRCDTGENHRDTMSFWEPQVTLFQRIPIVQESQERFRVATSLEEATHHSTRFQCRFTNTQTQESITTLSVYKFDYEYITWRKLHRPMIDRKGGKDTAMFWLSTLLFSCPVPEEWQEHVSQDTSNLYLDLIPIRTPIRIAETLLTVNHTGPEEYAKFYSKVVSPLDKIFGPSQYLPAIEDAGRWANLPICPRPKAEQQQRTIVDDSSSMEKVGRKPPYQLVACTWASASYTRRGDAIRLSDSVDRLREWILFHLMVGVSHVYVYDNSDLGNSIEPSELWKVTQEFPSEQVTYHRWPCKICNNNRPANSNPGERSSQYAAEASCRERYGPLTEWMTFLDIDEYLVPMQQTDNMGYDWRPILNDMEQKNVTILQFRSSRARPIVHQMEELEDQSTCIDPSGKKRNDRFPNTDRCLGHRKSETFLETYNCEYIRSPKPDRFDRARKQIYRTSHVWSHFVHYATVTSDYAETYSEFQKRYPGKKYIASAHGAAWEKRYPNIFADELATGVLIHARGVLPHESRRRSVECTLNSMFMCMLGYPCEDSVEFVDELHQKNVFANPDGTYCNCWKNEVVTETLVPSLAQH